MILLEIKSYQKPKAVPCVRYCLYSCSSRGHREPPNNACIATALGCPLEPHGKTLSLNVPHFGHRTQSNQVGIELEDSSLVASSSGARRCFAGCGGRKVIGCLTQLGTPRTTVTAGLEGKPKGAEQYECYGDNQQLSFIFN